MSQAILRNEDFKSGATFDNIRGVIYKGNGSPVNRVDAANPGAIYIDNYTGQLWVSLTAGDPATWRPYFSDVTENVRIDSDVQDGDLVGIFGPGSWSLSGNLSISRYGNAGGGSQKAAFTAAGSPTAAIQSETFNGSTWALSGAISTSKIYVAGAGSQNAGLIAGGYTTLQTRVTELFDGSTWAASGFLSVAKYYLAGMGSQNAGLVAGGVAGTRVNVAEAFNGATWSTVANISLAKRSVAGAGSQNAAIIFGGFDGVVGITYSETFNGSAWSAGPFLNTSIQNSTGVGSQNSCINMAGNNGSIANVAELFNGSSWSFTESLNQNKQFCAGAGSQSSGLVNGGIDSATLGATELHNQSIYRKLTYNSSQCALNVGMAYNVTTTSLTASVMRGDLPSTYVPGNTWFGISRFNNVDNNVYVSSATATINSISSSLANQATLNLSADIATGFAVGGILLISDGTKVPVVGGTSTAPIVRWENVSSSASTSLTVACLWGHRMTFGEVTIEGNGSGSLTISQLTDETTTAFYKGRVGDSIYIPYSATSGAAGSSIYAGTYTIQSVIMDGDYAIYTVESPITSSEMEMGIGGVTVLQQIVCKSNSFSADDIALGYRNKMRFPMNAIQDDMSNGRF